MLPQRITWPGLILVLMLSQNALPQLTEPARPQHTSYRTVKVDGLAIFYREAGPKDAPALLLLHGFPSSSRMFEPLFARLSDRYHLNHLARFWERDPEAWCPIADFRRKPRKGDIRGVAAMPS